MTSGHDKYRIDFIPEFRPILEYITLGDARNSLATSKS